MSDFCGIYVFCTAKLKHLPIPLTTEVARILWQVSLKEEKGKNEEKTGIRQEDEKEPAGGKKRRE